MPKKIEPTGTTVKKESPKAPAQTAAAKSPAVEPAKPAPAPAPAPKAAEKPAAAAAPAPAKAAEKPAAAPAPAKAAEKPAAAPAPAKAAEKPATAPAPAKAAEKPAAAPAKAEKPAAKAAKPAVQPESGVTVVVAKYDVGHGNHMFIRGEGAGLSWDSGIQMENAGNDVWVWTTNELKKGAVSFKFLINDAGWSIGDNMTAAAGETTTLYPSF
jgi:membrane protein involved in colicin uptake